MDTLARWSIKEINRNPPRSTKAVAFRGRVNEEGSIDIVNPISGHQRFLCRLRFAYESSGSCVGISSQTGDRGVVHVRGLFHMPACGCTAAKVGGATARRRGSCRSLGRARDLLESTGLDRSIFFTGVDAKAGRLQGIFQDQRGLYATDGRGRAGAVCGQQRTGRRNCNWESGATRASGSRDHG